MGIDWKDLGINTFGGVHAAGRVLATAFGGQAGAQLADAAEGLETQGNLLPSWAKKGGPTDILRLSSGGNAQSGPVAVSKPDYVVVQRKGRSDGEVVPGAESLLIVGGSRFAGNGYQSGEAFGQRFTFGVDGPNRVEIMKGGHKAVFQDVAKVLVCGGSETTRVAGIEGESNMFKILGDLIGTMTGRTRLHDLAPVREVGDGVYLHGIDVLGAVDVRSSRIAPSPDRLGFVKAKTPGGRDVLALQPKPLVSKSRGLLGRATVRVLTDQQVAKNAIDVGRRAQALGAKLLKRVAKAASAKGIVKVQGIGALSPNRRSQLMNHPKLSLAQIKKIAEDTIAAGKALEDKGGKHLALAALNKKRIEAGVKAAAAKLTPRVTTAVRGDEILGSGGDFDILGRARDYEIYGEEILGEAIVLGAAVDMLGEGEDQSYSDSGAGGSSSSGLGVPGPDDNNYGVGAPPTLEDAKKSFFEPGTFDTEAPGGEGTTYNSLPTGAIPFVWDAASRQPPFKAITSLNTYKPGTWGNGKPDGGVDADGVGAGFEWHGDDGSKFWVYWPANGSTNNVVPPNPKEAADLDTMFDASLRHQWGPLVGAVTMPDWAGLRYLRDGSHTFFWFRDKAPDWATAPLIQQELSKLTTAYATALTAAKQNYAAAVAADALEKKQAEDLAKQQAREDEATARRHQKEQEEAQHQADLEAQRQATEQGKLDLQARQIALQARQNALSANQGGYDDPFADAGYGDQGDQGVDWGDGDQGGGGDDPYAAAADMQADGEEG